jgi:GNAT superfamily N-acetyltransferase
VGLALLVVLDRPGPAERLAFVLHDLFAAPFREIAPLVGRSPNAAKMLASRARRRVRGAAPGRPGSGLARAPRERGAATPSSAYRHPTATAAGPAGAAVVREIHDLYVHCNRGQEELEPLTPRDFEAFVAAELEGPQALPEAWFLARADGRVVGLSTLERLPGAPAALDVGYAAVHPACRGRGLALALKLRTVAYAAAHGHREIRTANHAGNARMLAINAALGFAPAPARLTFEGASLAPTERFSTCRTIVTIPGRHPPPRPLVRGRGTARAGGRRATVRPGSTARCGPGGGLRPAAAPPRSPGCRSDRQ